MHPALSFIHRGALRGGLGGGYVVAYVEDTSDRDITKRDLFGYEGSRYVNPQPRIILEIADCSDRIRLEFELHSELHVENSLHKVDVLLGALTEFRADLVEEARLHRDREPKVDMLNRRMPKTKSARRRTRRGRGHPASSA
jgi:hypothetical protein